MKRPAFTLIELLLVITMISILAAISVPVFQSFQNKNDLIVAHQILADALRRAKILSEAGLYDSEWGVYIGFSEIVIFQGSNYSTRDTSYDEIYEISSGIEVSGLTEVVFSKGTGESSEIGSMVLTNPSGATLDLLINEAGALIY